MTDEPDAELIRRQSKTLYGIDTDAGRAAELADEVGRILAGSAGGVPGGLDQDPFAFAAVLRALKEPGG